MAKIGNGFAQLRNLRKLLKDLEGIDNEGVKGFLAAFFDAISSIVAGLQAALDQMAEAEATQVAVAYGEDASHDPQTGRRRITL